MRGGVSLTMIGTVLGERFASLRSGGSLLMNAIGLHNVDINLSVTLLLAVFAAIIGIGLPATGR